MDGFLQVYSRCAKKKTHLATQGVLSGSELYIFTELEPIYRQVRVSMEKIEVSWKFRELATNV